jgi:hypothetical protein
MNKPHQDDSDTRLSGVLGMIEKLVKLADDLQNAQRRTQPRSEIDLGKNSKPLTTFVCAHWAT